MSLLTWTLAYSDSVPISKSVRDALAFAGKAVFWRPNDVGEPTRLLVSSDDITWSIVDVDGGRNEDPNTTGVHELMPFDSKLAVVGAAVNGNRLAVYETTNLQTFTLRHAPLNDGDTAFDVQGAIAKVPNGPLWAFRTSDTEAYEDTGSSWDLKVTGLPPNSNLYSPEGAFGTVYVAATDTLFRWTGSTWTSVWASGATLNHMRFWSAQSRLILTHQQPTRLYAFDGTTTPPPQIFSDQITGTVTRLEVIGQNLYIVTVDGTGINGTTVRVYECTDLDTITQIGLIGGFSGLTFFTDTPFMFHPETNRFLVAFYKFTSPATQYIYKADAPGPSRLQVWLLNMIPRSLGMNVYRDPP